MLKPNWFDEEFKDIVENSYDEEAIGQAIIKHPRVKEVILEYMAYCVDKKLIRPGNTQLLRQHLARLFME